MFQDPVSESPPLWRVQLESNPVHWSPDDVRSYLSTKPEVASFADKFRDEEIDGEALLLLNLPTLLEHWSLKMRDAITLSRHIESVKFAFYKQFAFIESCSNGREA